MSRPQVLSPWAALDAIGQARAQRFDREVLEFATRKVVTVDCRICATPTPFLASKLCDRCVGGSPQERVPTTK